MHTDYCNTLYCKPLVVHSHWMITRHLWLNTSSIILISFGFTGTDWYGSQGFVGQETAQLLAYGQSATGINKLQYMNNLNTIMLCM